MKININKKIKIILGILVAAFALILVFFLLNKESKGVIIINNEIGLRFAVGKQVFMRAKLYSDKLPLLVFGKTSIYCWQEIDGTGKWSLCKVPNMPKRHSKQSVNVKVWGRLEIYQERGPVPGQLREGHYEIYVSRLEVDGEVK